MQDIPLTIPKNPPQIPPSQFRISRNLKVRGDAIYIIFGGIVASAFLFFCLMDISAILALAISWIPLTFAVWFYFRFVREPPRYYFDYWINGFFGRGLRIDRRNTIRLEGKPK